LFWRLSLAVARGDVLNTFAEPKSQKLTEVLKRTVSTPELAETIFARLDGGQNSV
jgi:hypothetical protein